MQTTGLGCWVLGVVLGLGGKHAWAADDVSEALKQAEAALVARDFLSAQVGLESLAAGGHAAANFYLGQMYAEGLIGGSPDAAKAEAQYLQAARLGEGRALHSLGMQALRGDVTGSPDPKRAREWFDQAVALGMEKSMQVIGMMYYHGTGTPKDLKLAREWWEKASAAGDVEATYNLGSMYFVGKGVKRDQAKAVALWQEAAKQGSSAAQNALGGAYLEGKGVAKDPSEAFVWFRVASGFGRQQSTLNANMAAGQLDEAGQVAAEAEAQKRFEAIKATLNAKAGS